MAAMLCTPNAMVPTDSTLPVVKTSVMSGDAHCATSAHWLSLSRPGGGGRSREHG